MANVAFIYTVTDLATIKHKSLKLFPLTTKLKAYLTANKLEYKNYEDYFPKNLSKKLNRYAGKWATYSQFPNNLSLSLHNYFAKKLFQLAALDNLIKTERPDEVYLGREAVSLKKVFTSNFDGVSELIKLVCKKNKVKLNCNSLGSFWLLKYLVQFLLPPRLYKVTEENNYDYKVLIAAHHYHASNILPLLLFLQKSRFKPLLMGRIVTAKRILDKNRLKYIEFNGEISFKNFPSYLVMKLKLLLYLFRFLKETKTFSYHKYNLWPIFKPKLISLFLTDALRLYTHKIFFREIAHQNRPSLFLTVTNDSTNQILIQTAKNLGIPTLEIQHGITTGYDGVYLKSDKFAVWGKIPKSIYAKNCVDSGKIVITGWPGYESHLTKTYLARKINRENLSISFLAQDPEGASLLFMNKTPEENLGIFFKAISTLSFKNKVFVRLHPRADKTVPFAVASKYGVKFILSETEPLGDLLLKTDIVVGQTTTATLDAIIMNKPVIYLPSMSWPTKFVEGSDAVYEPKDAGDIGRFVELIIDKGMSSKMVEAQKKFIADYCNFSKSSVNLISRQIEEMINAKK